MKRVLHVMYNLERSGMETMLLSGAAEWARHGIACGVLVTAPEPGPLRQAMADAGYEVVQLPFRSRRWRWLPSLRSLLGFWKLCRRFDVVHIHVEAGATLYTVVAKLAGVPHLARSIHNTFLFNGPLRWRKHLSRAFGRALGVRFGMVSDSVARCERERFGNVGVRTTNWLDVDYFRPPTDEERRAARAELGCAQAGSPDDSLTLVSVANCNVAKNHTALLRALVPVAASFPVTYFHVGRERSGQPERALAAELGLNTAVRFEGSSPDPRRYFWAADAFVMPSFYEGLGVAALEAIASGCNAVLSDVNGLCEILASTHHTVATGTTPESIAEGLLRLARQPLSARRDGAREDSATIRELFSPRRGVDRMVDALYGERAARAETAERLDIAFCAPADVQALARFCGVDPRGVPPGLGSTATTPLICELLRRGHAVTLFTLSNELPEPVSFQWGRLRVFVEHSRTFGSARNFFRPEIAALRGRIRQENPAFVHAHWTYEFALAALGSGSPTVVTIHDLPWRVLANFRDRFRTIRLLMAYAVAARCRRYTAVSDDAARHFRRWMRPGTTVEVIPNFVQAEILALGDTPPAEEARPPVCATVLQGWSRRKNATGALRAFAVVRTNVPTATLLMFGRDFEPGGPAQRWAEEQGLAEGVTFVGLLPYAELLPTLRDRVLVLMHPSLDEAFSMTIVEAMALGIAVVAGRQTPGVREALDDGRAGLIADVSDPRAMSAAVVRLLMDSASRADFARKGRARVLGKYTAEVVLPQYEALYESLSASRRGSPAIVQEVQP